MAVSADDVATDAEVGISRSSFIQGLKIQQLAGFIVRLHQSELGRLLVERIRFEFGTRIGPGMNCKGEEI